MKVSLSSLGLVSEYLAGHVSHGLRLTPGVLVVGKTRSTATRTCIEEYLTTQGGSPLSADGVMRHRGLALRIPYDARKRAMNSHRDGRQISSS